MLNRVFSVCVVAIAMVIAGGALAAGAKKVCMKKDTSGKMMEVADVKDKAACKKAGGKMMPAQVAKMQAKGKDKGKDKGKAAAAAAPAKGKEAAQAAKAEPARQAPKEDPAMDEDAEEDAGMEDESLDEELK